jgi:hypothetical protein
MFFKTNKFRKGAGRAAVVLATTALLATGIAPANASDATPIFLTFETGDTLGAPAATQAFEDGAASIAASDHLTGKSLKFVKGGSKAWSGVNVLLSPITPAHLADETLHTITLDYWSNDAAATPVMVALETSTPSYLGGPKVVKAVTAQPGLNHLSFDMSTGIGWNATTEWVTFAIFPNFSTDDTGYSGATPAPVSGQVYEIDNVSINGGTAPVVARAATSTLLTFEANDSLGAGIVGASEGAKLQGAFAGAETTIADAPAGGNGGKALKIVKKTGGQIYAGVNMLNFAADTRITNSGNKLVTFNYYAPKAGPVRVELTPYPVALGVTKNAVQGWQTLSFDMSTATATGESANAAVVWSADTEYPQLALFPDLNNPADDSVYYVDNFAINGATTPAIPVVPTTVAPVQRTAASVSGTAKIGKTLTVSKGSWTGTPTPTYSYKWYRCTVSGSTAKTTAPTSSLKCVAVAGKTSTTYKLAAADKGKYIRAFVTVKNSKGTKYSLTKTTAKVS